MYLHPEIEKRENVIKELTAADEISENDVDGDEWEDIYMSGIHKLYRFFRIDKESIPIRFVDFSFAELRIYSWRVFPFP